MSRFAELVKSVEGELAVIRDQVDSYSKSNDRGAFDTSAIHLSATAIKNHMDNLLDIVPAARPGTVPGATIGRFDEDAEEEFDEFVDTPDATSPLGIERAEASARLASAEDVRLKAAQGQPLSASGLAGGPTVTSPLGVETELKSGLPQHPAVDAQGGATARKEETSVNSPSGPTSSAGAKGQPESAKMTVPGTSPRPAAPSKK